ncbi:hypothetical protein F4604DRAFT_1683555 [Suillus subluteus]|nr:hypothetical protein F4604DRAFT_1683555 [Suillus subluteus]
MNANAKSQQWGPMAICRSTVTVSAEQKQDDEHAISWNPKRHEREKSAPRPNSESAIYHTGIVTAEQEQQAQNPWRYTATNGGEGRQLKEQPDDAMCEWWSVEIVELFGGRIGCRHRSTRYPDVTNLPVEEMYAAEASRGINKRPSLNSTWMHVATPDQRISFCRRPSSHARWVPAHAAEWKMKQTRLGSRSHGAVAESCRVHVYSIVTYGECADPARGPKVHEEPQDPSPGGSYSGRWWVMKGITSAAEQDRNLY